MCRNESNEIHFYLSPRSNLKAWRFSNIFCLWQDTTGFSLISFPLDPANHLITILRVKIPSRLNFFFVQETWDNSLNAKAK